MSVGVQCEFLIEIDQPTTSTASPKSGYLLRVARAEDKRKYLVWCVEVSTMRLILNTRLRELAAAARGSQDVAFDLKPRNVLIYQIIYLFHDHMEHPADLSHVREKKYIFPSWIQIDKLKSLESRVSLLVLSVVGRRFHLVDGRHPPVRLRRAGVRAAVVAAL